MTPNITILIHTHNEEKNLKECIESALLLSDNIMVIDMESTDNTVAIAQSKNVSVRTFPFSQYVEPARAFGIQQATTDWVFILDADERMTKELAEEISHVILICHSAEKNPVESMDPSSTPQDDKKLTTDNLQPITHYKIPRKNIFGSKKWLQHGGWWPDHQLRLLNRTFFKDWPDRIHSTPTIEGTMGYLNEPFLHYFHGNIEEMVNKTMLYEGIEAQLLYEAKKPVSTFTFFRKFLGELFRRLILKKGFLDGKYGVIESFYQAYSKTITYLFLFEKYQHDSDKKSSSV